MKKILIIAAVAALAGCGTDVDRLFGNENCQGAMDNLASSMGAPEDVYVYRSEDRISEAWWYWSRGVQYRFTWGRSVKNCERSSYEFTPV